MGTVNLHDVKQSFLKLLRSVEPSHMTQFVVWLDVKLSEYKVNGFMRLGG